MRKQGRTDDNQTAIVAALRKIGASVAITSSVGDGFPDLLVGYRGTTTLLELKNPKRPKHRQKLTEAEAYFMANWKGGPAMVVKDEHEAIAAVLKP